MIAVNYSPTCDNKLPVFVTFMSALPPVWHIFIFSTELGHSPIEEYFVRKITKNCNC